MLVGVIVAVRPIDVASVKLTVPLNPFRTVTVAVELPLAPARIVMAVGLAPMAKSTTWTVTVMACVRVPLELLIVAV
jgi:hypothetical protein